jgi:hypothetical protein
VTELPLPTVAAVDGAVAVHPVRGLIDLAPEIPEAELRDLAAGWLSGGLFTLAEAWARLDEPDMAGVRGAELLRRLLRGLR